MNRGTRRLLKGVAALLVLGLVTVGGAMGFRAVAGGDVGETCSMDFGCKPGGLCALSHGVQRMCTRPCNADGECPAGWGCGDALLVDRSEVLTTRQRVCLPGDGTGP